MEIEAAFEHVRLLLASGEDGEAVRVLERLMVVEPAAQELLIPVAATLLDRGHPSLAVRLAEGVLEDDPWSSPAHQVRVDALADAGDPLASVSAALAWVAASPDEIDAYLALSWAYLAVHDSHSAADAAVQARDVAPLSPIGWLGMAWVARLDGRWEDVDRWSSEALLVDPMHHDAQIMRAEALAQMGDTAAARNVLRHVEEDGRSKALRRSLWMHRVTLQMAVLLAVGLVVVGVMIGSVTFAAVPLVTGCAFGWRIGSRYRARDGFGLHPLTIWAGVVAVVAVVWSLLT